jgi:hypothetical protein
MPAAIGRKPKICQMVGVSCRTSQAKMRVSIGLMSDKEMALVMGSMDIFQPGMRFSKEFALFLKELDRKLSGSDQPGGEK